MSDDFITAFTAVLNRLQTLANEDAQFRTQLRGLVRGLLAFAEEPPHAVTPAPPAATTVAPPAPPALATPAAPPSAPNDRQRVGSPLESVPAAPEFASYTPPAVAYTTSAAALTREPSFRSFEPISDEDLPWIAARCTLKAEAARWAATRQRQLAAGADLHAEIEPKDRDIIAQAKALPECFLWMSHPSTPLPDDLRLLEDVAGCFEATAAAIGLLQTLLTDLRGDPAHFEQALDLAAEAQSGVRASITVIDGKPDTDQLKLFRWLRATAMKRQILIRRFMRIDDAADPTKWAELLERIAQLDARIEQSRQSDKKQRGLLNKVRYHLKRLAGDAAADADHAHDWQQIVEAVDTLVRGGLPPSNVELRELLLPVIDDLPDLELPQNFDLVLREIERFVDSRPVSAGEDAHPAAPIPEVRKVAELLHGRTLLLIGGDERARAREALADAFHCPVIWHATREQQTRLDFEGDVARADVAAVLLAIRFSRHAFGDVKIFCERYNKPLVRLPAGYGPNQVAVQILNQISERLKNGRREPVA